MRQIYGNIQTYYDGYKFRSRLEARWAVFFNALGIKYEYEPEGYILNNGTKYLPNFKLYYNGFHIFAEVKPLGDKFEKSFEFSKIMPILLLDGPPDLKMYTIAEMSDDKPCKQSSFNCINNGCAHCINNTIVFLSVPNHYDRFLWFFPGFYPGKNGYFSEDSLREELQPKLAENLIRAIKLSKQERFENRNI